jgi:sugar lactone lactonase YvrE
MTRTATKLILALSLALGLAAAQVGGEHAAYELPGDDTYPEGIAYHEASGTIFVSGAGSGALYRVDLESGDVETVLEPGTRGPFSTIGMTIDEEGTLWVAGGQSGEILRFDAESGEQLETIMTPAADDVFLNDAVMAPNGDVYVTDSARPVLFRVPAGSDAAESWLEFTGTPFEYVEGFNANGIAVTDDGRYLIVVQMNTGALYRIEVSNREVTTIDLGGESVMGGDGLVLDGTTLYVVQNGPDMVAVVELADDYASGSVERRIEDERLVNAATAALVDGDLLVTVAQFGAMQSDAGPDLPFTVVRVPVDQ